MGKNKIMRVIGLLVMCSMLSGGCTEYEIDGYTHHPIEIDVKGITTSRISDGFIHKSEVAASGADFTVECKTVIGNDGFIKEIDLYDDKGESVDRIRFDTLCPFYDFKWGTITYLTEKPPHKMKISIKANEERRSREMRFMVSDFFSRVHLYIDQKGKGM